MSSLRYTRPLLVDSASLPPPRQSAPTDSKGWNTEIGMDYAPSGIEDWLLYSALGHPGTLLLKLRCSSHACNDRIHKNQ